MQNNGLLGPRVIDRKDHQIKTTVSPLLEVHREEVP